MSAFSLFFSSLSAVLIRRRCVDACRPASIVSQGQGRACSLAEAGESAALLVLPDDHHHDGRRAVV
jgi:hypothetical protein